MRIAGDAALRACAIGQVGVGRDVPRVGRVLEPGEDGFHELAEVAEGHVAPDGAAELLVPVKQRARRRARVEPAAEKLAVEHPVTVRVRDHEVAHVQVLGLAHVKDAGGGVIPGAIAVIGVNVVLAGVPAARPCVGPALELDFKNLALSAL